MTYEQRKAFTPGNFKRACGVSPQPFEHMLQGLRDQAQRKGKPGRPATLALEEQRWMARHYWREYRPYFPLGLSWGLDESGGGRTGQKSANWLRTSQAFHLPGKKQWRAGGTPFDVIVVDGADSPVEGPPKNNGETRGGRKSARPKKRTSS